MKPEYYQFLTVGDTFQKGDEYYDHHAFAWFPTPENVFGDAWEAESFLTRRKLDTNGVDPSDAEEIWCALHALLRSFTSCAEVLHINPDDSQVSVVIDDLEASTYTLAELFSVATQVLKQSRPNWGEWVFPTEPAVEGKAL